MKQYLRSLQRDRKAFEAVRTLDICSDISSRRDMVPCLVMAPVMSWFILWVIREAAAAGKKRLYFLARDGYSMYRLAKIVCKRAGINLECRYLYCSRYAWRGAEYHLLKEDSLKYICLGGIDVTARKLMARAGLSPEEIEEAAGQLGLTERLDEPLSYRKLREMEQLFRGCPSFLNSLEAHAVQKYPFVCGYLEQEGLLEEVPYALVDSGWTGSMQKSLQNLLHSMGCEKNLEGYYFGLYEYPAGMPRKDYHCWYFSPESHIRRKVHFSNSLFECIFSSPEGMTTGYLPCDEGYIPIFEREENPNVDYIQYTTVILEKYITMFLKLFPEAVDAPDGRERSVAEALLSEFMGNPAKWEADVFGRYVFCDDVIGERRQTVAAKLSLREIRKNRFFHRAVSLTRKKGIPVRESAWLEGSIALCENAGAAELWHCVIYKYGLYIRKRIKLGK